MKHERDEQKSRQIKSNDEMISEIQKKMDSGEYKKVQVHIRRDRGKKAVISGYVLDPEGASHDE